jgi:hypothetical protein
MKRKMVREDEEELEIVENYILRLKDKGFRDDILG